ncbi:zinc finger protein 501-like [Nerophis ophidion]|uniref:zinc finger protein 501-like n=1 Tax=Nerophis ophidion TaxID=159077 RepID=UPI002AE08EE9|nr:zinc finger protein 501-like [Nerophis ophidion]
MSKLHMLRALVDQRLTAAAQEIFVVLEKTIAEYEAELSRTKEENNRLMDTVFKKHQVMLHRTDVDGEHFLYEQQEEPQPLRIKEERLFKEEAMEHSISREGEDIEGLEESPGTGVPVKSEGEERGGAEPPTQHMTTEADGDHCGGSQADKLLAPQSDSEDTTSHSPDTDDEDSKDDQTCHTDDTHLKSFGLKTSLKNDTGEKCGKIFCIKGDLIQHARAHTQEEPFSCSVCGATFARKDSLKSHMRTHAVEKPFLCSVCDSRFAQRQQLENHMRTHAGEKPEFESSLARSQNLTKHVTVHPGEKPFPCSICGVCFSRKLTLTHHMAVHTGGKAFPCSICGVCFSRNRDLTIHMRRHTGERPFSCSMCDSSFVRSQELKKHMTVHTGEKPFCCSICGMCFSRGDSLMEHTRRHTGEKVLSCSVCGERFSYKYQLNKHKCAGENCSSKIEKRPPPGLNPQS